MPIKSFHFLINSNVSSFPIQHSKKNILKTLIVTTILSISLCIFNSFDLYMSMMLFTLLEAFMTITLPSVNLTYSLQSDSVHYAFILKSTLILILLSLFKFCPFCVQQVLTNSIHFILICSRNPAVLVVQQRLSSVFQGYYEVSLIFLFLQSILETITLMFIFILQIFTFIS